MVTPQMTNAVLRTMVNSLANKDDVTCINHKDEKFTSIPNNPDAINKAGCCCSTRQSPDAMIVGNSITNEHKRRHPADDVAR